MAAKYTAESSSAIVTGIVINNVADGGVSNASDTISNDAAGERHLFANFKLTSNALGFPRKSGAVIYLFVIPEFDGVFPDTTTEETLNNYYAGAVYLDETGQDRVLMFTDIRLPPSNYQIIIGNETGLAFDATGNTFEVITFNYEDT